MQDVKAPGWEEVQSIPARRCLGGGGRVGVGGGGGVLDLGEEGIEQVGVHPPTGDPIGHARSAQGVQMPGGQFRVEDEEERIVSALGRYGPGGRPGGGIEVLAGEGGVGLGVQDGLFGGKVGAAGGVVEIEDEVPDGGGEAGIGAGGGGGGGIGGGHGWRWMVVVAVEDRVETIPMRREMAEMAMERRACRSRASCFIHNRVMSTHGKEVTRTHIRMI